MTIRADSFSSVAEVVSYTRHLLDGYSTFNSTTRPTLTEIEKFIDRSSGMLNVAIAAAGFSPSAVRSNSTAKLACDDWVTQKATRYAELTQRGTGYSVEEGSRTAAFSAGTSAAEFVDANLMGFIYLGISQSYSRSDGLQFTGMTAQSDRSDPDDTSKEQPMFGRKKFDNE